MQHFRFRFSDLSHFIHTEADLAKALAALIEADPRLRVALDKVESVPLRRRPDGFEGLAGIVVSQQLSTASANAIFGRLRAALNPFDPATMLRTRAPKLARTGLSVAKIRALKAIAKAIERNTLDLAALAELPADDAHRTLVTIHGIGPWTADTYLLICLGHSDAWPAGDVALQEAVRRALALRERPTAKAMILLAEPWRPWRGVAARLLWAYYRAVKRPSS
jgi:DNA-3-methyladenine glycosylase II